MFAIYLKLRCARCISVCVFLFSTFTSLLIDPRLHTAFLQTGLKRTRGLISFKNLEAVFLSLFDETARLSTLTVVDDGNRREYVADIADATLTFHPTDYSKSIDNNFLRDPVSLLRYDVGENFFLDV